MPNAPSQPRSRLTPAEFAARFHACSRTLWCIAAGVLGDRHHAEDILQEAALTALEKLDSFRPESNFVAWMGQTVRFIALNHRRKHERRQQMLRARGRELQVVNSASHEPVMGFDAKVLDALQDLGETPRTCLLLKTVVELEYAEIAELLEIPAGTAMSHVSRARARMQQLLAEPEPKKMAVRRGR